MKKAFQKTIQSRLALVLIVVFAAFLAAFLGQVLVTSIGGGPSLAPNQSFIISQGESPVKVLREADEHVRKVEQASFFSVSDTSLKTQFTDGVILSNDGWAVAVNAGDNAELWTTVRLHSGELVKIESQVTDPSSNLVFLKLDTDVVTPVTLAREWSLKQFDGVIVYAESDISVVSTYLGLYFTQSQEVSSDEINRYHVIKDSVNSGRLFNQDAEFLGLTEVDPYTAYSRVYSAIEIRDLFDQVVRSGEIVRPQLGFLYQDLSHISSNLATQGAVITELNSTTTAIRVNDIILSVDGILLNDTYSLSDAVLKQKTEDTIDLGILRNGQTINIEVIL